MNECGARDVRSWERTMDIIQGYLEVNDDVESETMSYLREVWTERQRDERNRVNVFKSEDK